jgi:hypothetical protein
MRVQRVQRLCAIASHTTRRSVSLRCRPLLRLRRRHTFRRLRHSRAADTRIRHRREWIRPIRPRRPLTRPSLVGDTVLVVLAGPST